MRHSIWVWAAPLAAALGALVVYGYVQQRNRAADDPVPIAEAQRQERLPAVPASPPIVRPASDLPEPLASLPPPDPDPEVTLPPLDESDEAVREMLAADFPSQPALDYLQPRELVRRFVTTLDNLPNEAVAVQRLPVKEAPGPFIASGTPDHPVLAEENFARYTPFVTAVAALDPATLVAAYHRMYPLLQQAYVELGYPNRELNTRLLEVIEHLLETPEVHGSIALKQPNVLYTFADPALESLSAGQKTLLRMGPENAATIKAKLRDIRSQLIAQAGERETLSEAR